MLMFTRNQPIPPVGEVPMPDGPAKAPSNATLQRRQLLPIREALQGKRPYRESWKFQLSVSSADRMEVEIAYVPGHGIVDLDRADRYFRALSQAGGREEAQLSQLFDDLVAELAPRWLKLEARYDTLGFSRTLTFTEERPDFKGM